MSGNQSWRKSVHSHHDEAILLVRKCVATLRAGGDNTESALSRLAPALKSTGRRMRTFFYHLGTPVVMMGELRVMRRSAVNFFYAQRDHHLALAARCEEEAEALRRAEQLEFSWEPEWHGNVGLRGRTAVGRR